MTHNFTRRQRTPAITGTTGCAVTFPWSGHASTTGSGLWAFPGWWDANDAMTVNGGADLMIGRGVSLSIKVYVKMRVALLLCLPTNRSPSLGASRRQDAPQPVLLFLFHLRLYRRFRQNLLYTYGQSTPSPGTPDLLYIKIER